jgi:hypothetical protein
LPSKQDVVGSNPTGGALALQGREALRREFESLMGRFPRAQVVGQDGANTAICCNLLYKRGLVHLSTERTIRDIRIVAITLACHVRDAGSIPAYRLRSSLGVSPPAKPSRISHMTGRGEGSNPLFEEGRDISAEANSVC